MQQAWNLTSVNDAAAILGADAGATGATVAAPAQTARAATTLAAVAADTAGLQNLSNARSRIVANTTDPTGECVMRTAWIASPEALRERMIVPQQVAPTQPEAEMPPYMESFLAHLRLLVGVPFDYLVPDERLLPDESIRFFYIDRSWTDRLVDGAIAVGKIGTREQAHHQAHAPAVNQQLDQTERIVRDLQRGIADFATLKANNDNSPAAADVITGFLLRSQAVSGWPSMDVRAYSRDIAEPLDPADPKVYHCN